MDVYMGSDEGEQFDMWFSNRELRTQFEAVDHLTMRRKDQTPSREKTTRPGRNQRFGRMLARFQAWPAQV